MRFRTLTDLMTTRENGLPYGAAIAMTRGTFLFRPRWSPIMHEVPLDFLYALEVGLAAKQRDAARRRKPS